MSNDQTGQTETGIRRIIQKYAPGEDIKPEFTEQGRRVRLVARLAAPDHEPIPLSRCDEILRACTEVCGPCVQLISWPSVGTPPEDSYTITTPRLYTRPVDLSEFGERAETLIEYLRDSREAVLRYLQQHLPGGQAEESERQEETDD
jgi:hypothetical protein